MQTKFSLAQLADSDTAESEKFARDFAPRKVINLDIHPGAGIHVVGDAHQLSRFFRHGSFAAVASGSVLEHLTAPWLFAAEVNRVLMMGGMTFQTAPFAWPEHSMPNDFWRFTPSGLAQLFGPLLGFEVLNTGSTGNASIVPSLDWRHGHLRMPTIVAPGTSWILARKVRDIEPGAVAWPLHGEAVARAYPVEALARWTPQP